VFNIFYYGNILSMRIVPIVSGEYYHIFGRGNNKQKIFRDKKDYIRFLFLILYFQSPIIFINIGRMVSYYVKHSVFNIADDVTDNIAKTRYIELIGFSLMPNHYHLIIYGIEDDGIPKYMQRILNSYTKYFNTKYDQSGHLFQGPYKAVHIEDDNQLSYLSAYQHRNPNELKEWKGKELKYSWSSYQDYVGKNRWGDLLKNDIIMDRFENGGDYNDFVQTSGAKESFDD